MATSTPWGPAQSSKKFAKGIVFYSTAGHGGFHLTKSRQAEMKEKFPWFTPWGGNHEWFEEDCDANVVIMAWPWFFKDESLACALRIANSDSKYYSNCKNTKHWNRINGNS